MLHNYEVYQKYLWGRNLSQYHFLSTANLTLSSLELKLDLFSERSAIYKSSHDRPADVTVGI